MIVTPSPSFHRVMPLLIIASASFMEHLDSSIIATALPTIATSLHTDPLRLNLAITAYLFGLAAFIPLSGWMADRFGARNVFRAAIVVFTLGSMACGLAVDLGTLVAARLLQGIGGAMMVPVGRLVLLRTVPKAELVDAMAWVTAPALIGPVLGPPIGGLIVTYTSWRWIFFVNVPMGLLGLALAGLYIEEIRGRSREPLDLLGFVMIALAMAGLIFGCETAGHGLLPSYAVAGCLAIGAAGIAAYAWHVRRIAHPIVDIGILKFQTFRISVIGGTCFRCGIGALPFLLPLMLQIGFGLSPLTSGFLTFAGAVGAVLMKLFATRVLRTFGFRQVLVANASINAVFMGGCALFFPETPHSVIFLFLLIGGFVRSMQFTALNALAYADIPEPLMSRANTLYNMFQQTGLSLGVAVGALLLDLTLSWRARTDMQAGDFWPAYVGIAALSLISAFFFKALPPQAGAEVSGHRARMIESKEAV